MAATTTTQHVSGAGEETGVGSTQQRKTIPKDPQSPPVPPRTATINENAKLQAYYASLESRIGYRLFLGGTRHFGFYESEHAQSWRINRALRRMETELLRALDVPAGSKVLDAGCGVGHVAIHMARTGKLQVQAIDVVARHAQHAQANVAHAGVSDHVRVQRGDYHHLDALFEPEQFDGVYTMETFVHATDPRAVLRQFLRVLKPGGHLAMHEYDHVDYTSKAMTAEGKRAGRAMTKVNEYAAMPANQAFAPGVLEAMLKEEGFVEVEVRDISRNIWPMLWLFYIVAWIPYTFISLLGLEAWFVNTVAGYWSWRGRETWRYVQVVGKKPVKDVK